MSRLVDSCAAVLFDLDGTLLDTARDLVRALHAVCDTEGQPRPDATLAGRYVSHGAIGLVRMAFPDADETRVEQLRRQLVGIYEQALCEATVPYPGVVELLAELDRRRIPWGIVTNKLRYLAEPIVQHFGFAPRCQVLVGGDTAARNKPHPDPLLCALDELGVAARDALYVGDAQKDVRAGQAAGLRTVAVTWGYIPPGEPRPHEWGADYTIDHPRDLLAL